MTLGRPILAAVVAVSLCVATARAQGPEPSPTAQAERLIRQGEFAAAERLLRPVAELGSDPTASYLLGFALIQLYRFEEAERWLRRALDSEPDNAAWLHALAKSLLEQGRNLAAIEVLDRALALQSTAELHYAKAMCALNAGEDGLAEAELRRCLTLQPDHADALHKLGRIQLDRGDYAAALPHLERSLTANPGHVEARYLFGLAASRSGRPAAAEAAFRRVLNDVPGHAGALYNLGRVLLEEGRGEEGQRLLDQFRELGRFQAEIDFYRRAVKKNPANLEGRLALAERLLQVGRSEEAVEQLLAARQLAPREGAIYRSLSLAFGRLGREEDARRAAQFAAQLERP